MGYGGWGAVEGLNLYGVVQCVDIKLLDKNLREFQWMVLGCYFGWKRKKGRGVRGG